MTIHRICRINCDRCKRGDDLLENLAVTGKGSGRRVKPVGWSHVSISQKTQIDKPVEVVKTADLCPDCVDEIIQFIINKTDAHE